MSVHSFQSRSSTDLGVSVPQTSTVHQATKPHIPRLQHSPSLPNIWFPPHSRPPNMSPTTRNSPNSPNTSPTPPALASHSPPTTPQSSKPKSHNDGLASALEKLSLKDDNTRRSTIKTTGLHTRKRQRKDRDTSYHLLTPPLTPSSSIRTTASAEFTEQSDKAHTLQELQEPEATRFLYLEDVSRSASPAPLQSAITDALACISSRRNSKCAAHRSAGDGSAEETSCIKGFFLRHTKTTGTLFLAFHDVRDALAAKNVLSQRTTDVLAEYFEEEKSIEGTNSWFRCRFITAEELVKTIGNSNFLATTDGGFLLSVAIADPAHDSNPSKQGIDVHLLAKILESYGDLRLLRPESRTENDECFLLEFFDVRDANEAYISLNEQTMFGMKLVTYGRVPQDVQEGDSAHVVLPNETDQGPSTIPQSNHQSSASESHLPRMSPRIGLAGEVSQMRSRFVGQVARSRPRAMSVGNETTSSPSPPRLSDRQPKAPSPTIFYTSLDFTDPYSTSSRSAHEVPTDDQNPARDDDGSSEVTDTPRHWEPQQTCSIADCRYCPSKGYDPSAAQPPFGSHINPSFINAIPLPVQSPQAFTTPNEFETHGLFPAVGWPFDPTMMAPNVGSAFEMFAPTFIPAIPVVPVEHRYPDQSPNPNFAPNTLMFSSISPAMRPQHHTFVEPQHTAALDHPIFVNNPTEPHSDANVAAKPSTTGTGVSDRNFLNIARIEEGLDTRTTVMIKNIPNKMTAKDLIQYISDVCLRKIDFLYLRMDFKNGCNVGYAFVNFIRVQDMLKFAKKRLGVKWNMFSSEKVLQMSYANYQGKEALVEKFKNSCIMDEREEWRPKIFYSNGPEQGLPEPFPAPTHLRRKERSSHNRGALYVPGAAGGSTHGTPSYLNNGPLRRQEYCSASGSKYLEHRNRHGDRVAEEGNRKARSSYERSH